MSQDQIHSFMKEFAIPMLPCNSIDETLLFYQALGFEVTYKQKTPNTYAAIKIKELELHFFVMKGLKAEANYSTCYLIVNDIDHLYESFREGLKKVFGKIPLKGYPRINPLKDMPSYGVRQFIVVDPSGNYIRIGQPIPKVDSAVFKDNNMTNSLNKNASHFEKVYELASRLADGQDDVAAAVQILDKELDQYQHVPHSDLLRLLVLRADAAFRLEDIAGTQLWVERARRLILDLKEDEIKEEIRLLDELENSLSES